MRFLSSGILGFRVLYIVFAGRKDEEEEIEKMYKRLR
jgi:hypothetical protein